jgi:hypothetical protein
VQGFLDPAQTPWPPSDFLDGLLAAVGSKRRAQYEHDLEKLCASDSKDREAAMKRLARLAAAQDIERLWANFLADTNADRRQQAAAAIPFIQDPDAALIVFAIGLESHDVAVRREMMRNVDVLLTSGYERAQHNTVARVVKALLPLLDDADLGTRQDAAWAAVTLIKAGDLDKLVRTFSAWTRKPAAPLTAEAAKLLDDVRAAAERWLAGG